MTVYVDIPKIRKGRLTAHLMADSLEELHEWAQAIGLKRCWFDSNKKHPHYDLHGLALASTLEGLEPISTKEMLKRLRNGHS